MSNPFKKRSRVPQATQPYRVTWVYLYLLIALLLTPAARAHVGSKDVFETVTAGPYTLYVTIRPPDVIPGIATVEVRSSAATLTSIAIAPLPVTGEAALHPPAFDPMQPSPTDPQFFTGAVWIMGSGAWQVRLALTGAAGPQTASVPVLAVPRTTLKMQRGMGTLLAALGLLLFVGMAAIVAASIRESRLLPGTQPTPALRRRSLIGLAVAAVVLTAITALAGKWWNVEAADYARNIYTASTTTATLSGNHLTLTVAPWRTNPRSGPKPRLDTWLPDHGHPMHLYAIRQPQMDAAFHLHPIFANGAFTTTLPTMPPGTYQLYGDVVHSNGFPETLQATIRIPANLPPTPLDSEDASALPPPLSAGPLPPAYNLPDGYTLTWDRPGRLTAGTPYTFHFHLLDPSGHPATNIQPYLGMAGHAAFVKTDGSVFAHTHPSGSAPMPDVMLADASTGTPMSMTPTSDAPLTPNLSFPYGFPTPGRYRLFIQIKHAQTVETGVFDAEVK